MTDHSQFTEVADRVWIRRHPWLDVTTTAVGGSDGVLVVDTGGSGTVARDHVDAVGRLGAGEVLAVVNTHWHFDHSFGNAVFHDSWPQAAFWAHEDAVSELARRGAGARAELSTPGHPDSAGHEAEIAETEVRVPEHSFSAARVLDLGGRLVELLHPGRGHTAGDAVLHVPDARVLLAGDLVEESGAPCYGDDSYPLDWPGTLGVLLDMLGEDTVVVPGHGAPVDRGFVEEQRGLLGVVAETVRGLAAAGVGVTEALDAGEWPWPREVVRHAVERGYSQLPRDARRLPLA